MKRQRSVSQSDEDTPKRVHHDLIKYTSSQVHRKFLDFIRRVDNHRLSDICMGDSDEASVWLTWLVEKEGVQDVCLPATLRAPEEEEVRYTERKGQPLEQLIRYNQARDIATVALTFHWLGEDEDGNEDVQITHINTVNLANALQRCTQPVAVLFLDLDSDNRADGFDHRGAMIFNFLEMTYERFEPNAGWFWPGVNRYLDSQDFRARAGLSEEWTYIAPSHTCPFDGPQVVAGNPRKCPDGGYCVVVSMIYIHLRMLMPLNDPQEIVNELLSLGDRRLLNVIRRYATWMHSRTSNASDILRNAETIPLPEATSLWHQLSEMVLPRAESRVAPWNHV